MKAHLRCARALTFVLIGEQRNPALLLPNSAFEDAYGSGRISYQVIRMYDPCNAARLVKLFFLDTNGYFAGFEV
jgi:hypothetical protein